MRGVYTAEISIAALAGATAPGKTLLYITAPAAAAVEILSASVTNASNETNEQLLFDIRRVGTLGTPTGTPVTPTKHESGDQAAASTVKGNVTASEPTYTANTSMGKAGAATLGGWFYQPAPEERPIIPPAGTSGLLLVGTCTAFDAQVVIVFREIG